MPHIVIMILALFPAVIIHEIAHGVAALALGDTTARDAGRLSLNPLRHIDPVGTIVLPLVLALAGSPVVFGWAKPVPVNLGRMRDRQLGMWATALAGPASNLLQAAVALALLRLLLPLAAPVMLGEFLIAVLTVNLVLMVFNLLPVPPLDGSRIVASVMPDWMADAYLRMSIFGMVILFMLLRGGLMERLLNPLFKLIGRLLAL